MRCVDAAPQHQPLSTQELNDEPGDFVSLFIQGEMAGIQQMNISKR